MANQFPPRDWDLRPNGSPYWPQNPLLTGDFLPPPTRFPWELPSAAPPPAIPFGSNGGILGRFGRLADEPRTDPWTMMRALGWGPPLPPGSPLLSQLFPLFAPPVMPAPRSRNGSPAPNADSNPPPVADQPAPVGQPPGGSPRPTHASDLILSADEREAQGDTPVLSDVTPDNLWIPGADYVADGHHEFPRSQYRLMPPETRKVFDEAKTGKLFVRSINGRRHEFDAFHRLYNAATGEILKDFLERPEIDGNPKRVTPAHAEAILEIIRGSNDDRIRLYNAFIKSMGRLYRLRSGIRGTE